METWKTNAFGLAHAFDPDARVSVCGRVGRGEVGNRRERQRCADCRVIAHNRKGGPTVLTYSARTLVERPRGGTNAGS